MHLKVVFDPETGAVIGPQAAAFDGADKRIDALVTAVRNKLTVCDQEECELAYAPPFGSAKNPTIVKDPVNMAGFVASNVVLSDLKFRFAGVYPAKLDCARVIDVRTPEEFSIWHRANAENMPLATLSRVCGELTTVTPIWLYRAVGFRSYIDYPALQQGGFTDQKTLSNGATTFRTWHEVDEADAPAQRSPIENCAESHSLCNCARTGISTSIDRGRCGRQVDGARQRPGFAEDTPARVQRNGLKLISIEPAGPGYVSVIR